MADPFITDFKTNTPRHFNYPLIISHQFSETDKKTIESKANKVRQTNVPEYVQLCTMREFIGELARDRVNETSPASISPILSWD